MDNRLHISAMAGAAAALAIVLTTSAAAAQTPLTLRSAPDAAAFCELSSPTAPEGHDEEAYGVARRRVAQRPIEVLVRATAAPVIEFDRVTSALEISVHRAAAFADGFAVAANVGTVGFELTEVQAHKLWARYDTGAAALKLTFLPLAWSDYDRPLCRQHDDQQILDAEILAADIVDETGRPIATYTTAFGREVALMRQHRIRGYLDGGTPVVWVSELTAMRTSERVLGVDAEVRLRSEIRTALYSCYLRGLSSNGRLQGALVVRLGAGESNATLLVDSLHDSSMSDCAIERLSAQRLQGVPEPQAIKATVIFRLEEAGAL